MKSPKCHRLYDQRKILRPLRATDAKYSLLTGLRLLKTKRTEKQRRRASRAALGKAWRAHGRRFQNESRKNKNWGERRGSNPLPPVPQTGALT
jgi:hypothetical protein